VLRTILFVSVVATVMLQQVACCRSSGGKTCTATIRYKGKTYEAKSDSSQPQSDATRLACRSHCKTDDPDVETAWRTWKASPEGAKSTRTRDAEMEVRTVLFDGVNRCQGTCVAEMVLNPALASVTCEK
jgi:hypothetical protein